MLPVANGCLGTPQTLQQVPPGEKCIAARGEVQNPSARAVPNLCQLPWSCTFRTINHAQTPHEQQVHAVPPYLTLTWTHRPQAYLPAPGGSVGDVSIVLKGATT